MNLVQGYLGQVVAQNWGFFVLGWILFVAIVALPHLFTWLWSIVGWNVTATRAASSSAKAAIREVLAEQEAAKKPGVTQ